MFSVKTKFVTFMGPYGGYCFCRRLSASIPRILMYHRFSENPESGYVHRESFELQIKYLKNNFNIITLGDLVKTYQQQGSFPVNSVVITVDDGYSDFYEIAYPILEKHNVPATFFVTTRFIDGDFWLWPDAIRYILECSSEVDLYEVSGSIDYSNKQMTNADRQALWGVIVTYLLSIDEDEKKRWIDEFAEIQAVMLPDRPTDEFRAVDWGQVKKMDASNIEIGAHTQRHPSLGRLDESKLFDEIQGAVDVIQNQIGHRPVSFCFPNGQPSDYTEMVKKHVKDAGCQSAVTAFYDENLVNDLFELRRFNISSDKEDFLRLVNGVDVLAAKYFKANNILTTSF